MQRRMLLGGVALTALGVAAGSAGLGVGACVASAPSTPSLRAGVLGGVEEEVLRFVAERNPGLGLKLERRASAAELRHELRSGGLDFGSFETAPELAHAPENTDGGLVSAGASVTLPFGLYSRKLRSLSQLGLGAQVALPKTALWQGRALLLLYQYGLVAFDEALGPDVRLEDVRSNPRGLRLLALPDAALAQRLDSDDLVALDYGSAAKVGLAPARSALGMEDGFSPCAQVLTVRERDRQATWLPRLLAAYRSSAVKEFILRRFQDSVRRAW